MLSRLTRRPPASRSARQVPDGIGLPPIPLLIIGRLFFTASPTTVPSGNRQRTTIGVRFGWAENRNVAHAWVEPAGSRRSREPLRLELAYDSRTTPSPGEASDTVRIWSG